MKTTEQGRLAEAAVAKYLTSQAFEIIGQNWRTRVCEIDIIAKKKKIVYFVEVKYRGSTVQGEGFEYITPRKLKQIKFAAEIWNSENNWSGDYRLLAASVGGPSAESIEIIEI